MPWPAAWSDLVTVSLGHLDAPDGAHCGRVKRAPVFAFAFASRRINSPAHGISCSRPVIGYARSPCSLRLPLSPSHLPVLVSPVHLCSAHLRARSSSARSPPLALTGPLNTTPPPLRSSKLYTLHKFVQTGSQKHSTAQLIVHADHVQCKSQAKTVKRWGGGCGVVRRVSMCRPRRMVSFFRLNRLFVFLLVVVFVVFLCLVLIVRRRRRRSIIVRRFSPRSGIGDPVSIHRSPPFSTFLSILTGQIDHSR